MRSRVEVVLLIAVLPCVLVVIGCDTTSSVSSAEQATAPISPAASSLDANINPAFADLAWLAGHWVAAEGFGDARGDAAAIPVDRTEEHWTAPAGGTMFGVGRTIRGGRTVFFEFLRIEKMPSGDLTYFAAPQGRFPPTPFKAVEIAPGRVVFENLEHDFPQRIIYTRTGDHTATARVEGNQGGQMRGEEWGLVRVEHP